MASLSTTGVGTLILISISVSVPMWVAISVISLH